MNQVIYDNIRNNENFLKLVKTRRRFIWFLTCITLIAYYSFILTIAFNPSFLAQKFGDTLITYGMPFGIGVIFLSFFLTGIYVKRANGEFDTLVDKIKKEVELYQ